MTKYTQITYHDFLSKEHVAKWCRDDHLRETRDQIDMWLGWNPYDENDRFTELGATVEIEVPVLMFGGPEEAGEQIAALCDRKLSAVLTEA